MKNLNEEIKDAVILAGGINSRMMPMSKVIPKVMLPVGRKPAIEYLINECLSSGIKNIYIVVREKGSLIEKYFKVDKKLRNLLKKRNKKEALKKLKKVESMGKYLNFVVQKNPHGEADALLTCIKKYNLNNSLAILLGDMVIGLNDNPAIKQLISKHTKDKCLTFSDGRLVLTKNGTNLYKERFKAKNKLDIRIMDLFEDKEKEFCDVEGREIKLGSPEDYEINFSL